VLDDAAIFALSGAAIAAVSSLGLFFSLRGRKLRMKGHWVTYPRLRFADGVPLDVALVFERAWSVWKNYAKLRDIVYGGPARASDHEIVVQPPKIVSKNHADATTWHTGAFNIITWAEIVPHPNLVDPDLGLTTAEHCIGHALGFLDVSKPGHVMCWARNRAGTSFEGVAELLAKESA
jgi:hypothetical protein